MAGTEITIDVQPADDMLDLSSIADSDKAYIGLVRDLCETFYNTEINVLETYWNTGDRLYHYMENQQVTGINSVTQAIEAVAEDIVKVSQGRVEYSKDVLWKMWRVRTGISSEQLERIVRMRLPVTKVLSLCVSRLSDDQREQILEEAESGGIKAAEIPGRVKQVCGPSDTGAPAGSGEVNRELDFDQDKGPRPEKGPMETLKLLTSKVRSSGEMIDSVVIHTSTMLGSDNVTDDDRESYLGAMQCLANVIETLNRKWQPIYDACVEGFDEALDKEHGG